MGGQNTVRMIPELLNHYINIFKHNIFNVTGIILFSIEQTIKEIKNKTYPIDTILNPILKMTCHNIRTIRGDI